MEVEPQELDEKATITVLVTGANSGLGFATCCRLIDEFLLTRPQSQSLHLLFSTRDTRKSDDTLKRLNAHLQKTLKKANGQTPGISLLLEGRIKLEGVLVDLTKLLTVKALAKQLLIRGQHLDAVVWNAGIAGWTGVNYYQGIWDICTKIVEATTYPKFMNTDVGALAPRQLGGYGKVHMFPEPRLGQVFTANVFGHYMLTHWLAPLMDGSTRIVWISSISCTLETFSLDDFQGLHTVAAYESSKRLTDLLVLTANLPSTQPQVKAFLPPPEKRNTSQNEPDPRPQMFVTHPGVISTTISGLGWFMAFWMNAALYMARWVGSPWHPVDAYKGAVSVVFAALAPPSQLADLEARDGKGKWGSATDVFGDERVSRTEIEGWGFGGPLGSVPSGSLRARRRGHQKTTQEMRENFEDVGRKCWQEMEELRLEWEKRLGDVDSMSTVDV